MDAATCIKVSDLSIDALCDLHPRLRKFVLHFSFNLMAHHCIANDFTVNLRLAACRGCKVERQTIKNFPTALGAQASLPAGRRPAKPSGTPASATYAGKDACAPRRGADLPATALLIRA